MSPYAYNTSNQLTSTPAATFTYDGNGNTLTKVASAGTTTYNWDFENRLTSVLLPGSGGTVTFKYDPFGRRIQKSSAAGTASYLYDGRNSVAELDGAANFRARYAQGAGIDEPLAELRGGAIAFYEPDGLGSVTSLTASAGTISNSYTYDAFGNTTSLSESFVNPYRYTARDHDAETGLQYSRARYYDSNVGRFLSEDPIGFKAGVNFYAYTGNDPIVLTDPLGYQECSPEQWAQSPHACAGPTDPDAPYQGADGLWYNIPPSNFGSPAPADELGQSSDSVPYSGPLCSCFNNPEYVAGFYAIIDEADPKHLKALAHMVGITGATTAIEHRAERAGSHFFGRWVAPPVEFIDIVHGVAENVKIERETQEKIKALKKKLRCE